MKPSSHLAVIGNGLFVLVDYVLGAETVLGPSDLSTGVGIYAIGGEGTCGQREKKQSFAFLFLGPFITLKRNVQEIRPKCVPLKSKPRSGSSDYPRAVTISPRQHRLQRGQLWWATFSVKIFH